MNIRVFKVNDNRSFTLDAVINSVGEMYSNTEVFPSDVISTAVLDRIREIKSLHELMWEHEKLESVMCICKDTENTLFDSLFSEVIGIVLFGSLEHNNINLMYYDIQNDTLMFNCSDYNSGDSIRVSITEFSGKLTLRLIEDNQV